MAAEEILVPRVYLRNPALWRSAHHRAMAPAPFQPDGPPGAPQAIVVLEFANGIASREDARGMLRPCAVQKSVYDMFAALGIATTERPLSSQELWERDNT